MNTSLALATLNHVAEQATAELDRLYALYQDAQATHRKLAYKAEFSKAQDDAYEYGLIAYNRYEAVKKAYSAIGLTNLGIHNN